MNELERMLRAAQRALDDGADPAAVDRHIAKLTNGRFDNLAGLSQAAQLDSAIGPDEGGPRQGILRRGEESTRLDRAADLVASGMTFGFADELRGAVRAPFTRQEGEGLRDAYQRERDVQRGRQGEARDDFGFWGSLALEGAGGLATGAPIFTAGRQVAARALPHVPGLVRGAGIGALEGAVAGAGHGGEEGGLSRTASGIVGGLLGGALGAAGEGIASGVSNVAARRAGLQGDAATVGRTLSERLKAASGLTGEADTATRQGTQAARQVFRELDQMGPLDDAPLRAVMRRDNVASVGAIPGEVHSGTRPPTFAEAQKAVQRATRAADRAWANGDMASFNEASRIARELGEALNDATGGRFVAANTDYRVAMEGVRAIQQGRKLARQPADALENALSEADGAVAQGLREGAASVFVQRLESGSAASFIKKANTPQMQRQLRAILGSEDAVRRFMADVERAGVDSRSIWRSMVPYLTGGGIASGSQVITGLLGN